MDGNKRAELAAIGFKALPTCSTCVHGKIAGDWGTCGLHEYVHLKHSGPPREMSVPRTGWCMSHATPPGMAERIFGGFAEFYDPKAVKS